jgi:hypothetical protein
MTQFKPAGQTDNYSNYEIPEKDEGLYYDDNSESQ